MSRIDSGECFCMDMEWYGVDKKGNIAVFCSAGKGYLPEFVCEDVERAEELMEYFDTVEKITESTLFFSQWNRRSRLQGSFLTKGYIILIPDNGTRFGGATLHEYYTKRSASLRPLEYERLPEHIRGILGHNRMDVEDFSATHALHVKHAYEVRI